NNRSPPAWGSTVLERVMPGILEPFPACAGINRPAFRSTSWTSTVPRLRGDHHDGTGPDVAKVLKAAAGVFEKLRVRVIEVKLPSAKSLSRRGS
ncbi:hypothetical protein, partial [Lutimaribacter pacificus]|uniref:hypothetical protein n=1 Tax=Lutimaribacter pacificus TaxID=391948 RepID=UPI001CB7FD89